MESSLQATNSLDAMELEIKRSPLAPESLNATGSELDNVSSKLIPTDDQYFLLYIIMGTYFAPNLKGETPQKSVLQRRAEGLPPYTSDQLAGSYIKTVEMESVYYYVLRNADQSLVVKLRCLHQFFHGNLPTLTQDPSVAYPQFNDLFPIRLHPHNQFENGDKIIENIVFINDPKILYIKPEHIKRFKKLTGLNDLLLDRDSAGFHTFVDSLALCNVAVEEDEFIGELLQRRSSCTSEGTEHLDDRLPNVHVVNPVGGEPYNTLSLSCIPYNDSTPLIYSSTAPLLKLDTSHVEESEPGIIFLPSCPNREEWSNIIAATKSGFGLTGSAAAGQIGPVLRLIDIGECEDSYLFRVSLPGVKRDEREFSCEVENDGKVLIRGVTNAGERTVYRHSQAFEMQSQNLCPPGHFSISFKLPGPVNPQQFSGNFGTDGILEGIVMKP